jgi:FlaA1/EpsC-like NDP-sugar epimerase
MLLPWVAVASSLIAMFMIDLTFESREPGLVSDLPRVARMLVTFAYKRRIVEVALDAFIIAASFSGAFLIRLDFKITSTVMQQIVFSMPAALLAGYAAFLTLRIYRGIWRYLGFSDTARFATAALVAGFLLKLLALAHLTAASGSIDLLFTILLFDLLVFSRASFIIFRKAIFSLTPSSERVLIVGAGRAGAAAAAEVASGREKSIRLVGFADDDPFKWGKLVAGRPVFGPLEALDLIHERTGFTQILIAAPLADGKLDSVQDFVMRRDVALHQFSIGINRIQTTGKDRSKVADDNTAQSPTWSIADSTASAR